jgi:hypothetical protein
MTDTRQLAHGNWLETAARTKAATATCIEPAKARIYGINRDPQTTPHAPQGHGKEGVDSSSPSEGSVGSPVFRGFWRGNDANPGRLRRRMETIWKPPRKRWRPWNRLRCAGPIGSRDTRFGALSTEIPRASTALGGETEHASVRLLAGPLLTIGRRGTLRRSAVASPQSPLRQPPHLQRGMRAGVVRAAGFAFDFDE